MKPVDIFLATVSELALILGAILLALWFQPKEPVQLVLGLVLIFGGILTKILSKKS